MHEGSLYFVLLSRAEINDDEKTRSMHMVKDYMNVFGDEIPILPPYRKTKFLLIWFQV